MRAHDDAFERESYASYWNSRFDFDNDYWGAWGAIIDAGHGDLTAGFASYKSARGDGNGVYTHVYASGDVFFESSGNNNSAIMMQNGDTNHWGSIDFGGANQGGYPVGLHQFLAIAVGESGGNFNELETKAIVSSMINRINQASTSLNDPNWLKKISYGGNTVSNFVATRIKPNGGYANVDYGAVMGMSMSQIMNSKNPYIQAAIGAYNNWGTDYSNPKGFADTGLYYWNATSGLKNSVYNSTDYVITLTAGGTTFYRPR